MAGQQPKQRFDAGFKAGSSSDPTRPLRSTDLIVIDRSAELTPSESTRIATLADVFTDMAGGHTPFTGTVVIPVDNDAPITLDFVNGLLVELTEGDGHGSGTVDDPYLVDSVDRLIAVNYDLSAHYKQTADINLAGVNWLPIGSLTTSFSGTYNGNGKSITNLMVQGKAHAGLFCCVSGAEISNLSLSGSADGETVGLLVGLASDSTFSDIDLNGAVAGEWGAGLLLGEGVKGNNINRCYAQGLSQGFTLTPGAIGVANIGGLVGMDGGSVYTDCGANVHVVGECAVAGGLVGRGGLKLLSGLTYVNCYACGLVDADASIDAGGLVGQDGNPTITSCYWDTEATGKPTSAGGTGKTTTQMKQQATFSGWDFVDTWEIDEGNDYPKLRR